MALGSEVARRHRVAIMSPGESGVAMVRPGGLGGHGVARELGVARETIVWSGGLK